MWIAVHTLCSQRVVPVSCGRGSEWVLRGHSLSGRHVEKGHNIAWYKRQKKAAKMPKSD